MDPTELLTTIAEVALGLAGFSGVMTAFMQRPGKLTDIEIYRIGVLLGASLGAMFLALLPLALLQFDPGSAAWRTSSATMACFALMAGAVFLATSYRVSRQAPEIFNRWIFAAVTLGHAANIILQTVAVVAADPGHAAGIYIVGLLWFLAHAAIQFGRILFVRPAGR